MLGFDTIGNATCIVYDGDPVLSTDPWLDADAYYGSWAPDFSIPPEQSQAIRSARYHWFSHGHPDHLNVACLPRLGAGQLLVSDHRHGRIAGDLRAAGWSVQVLPDRRWIDLSRRVAVFSLPNWNQDSVLLIRIGDQLVINLNDSPLIGTSFGIRRIARDFRRVTLLTLLTWGAVDMINVLDAQGSRRHRMDRRPPLGVEAQRAARHHGADRVVPFSSFHRYQRTDSLWANDLLPGPDDFGTGAVPGAPQVLPPFVRIDVEHDRVEALAPPQRPFVPRPPEAFGDHWEEPLEREDRAILDTYFKAHTHLRRSFGYLAFNVGDVEHRISLNGALRHVGIEFEAPRSSLMHAVRHRVFDDLLIANFAKVRLNGVDALYPDFTPYVAKYGDNGGALSRIELSRYFADYARRDPLGVTLHHIGAGSEQLLRTWTRCGDMARSRVRHFLGSRPDREP